MNLFSESVLSHCLAGLVIGIGDHTPSYISNRQGQLSHCISKYWHRCPNVLESGLAPTASLSRGRAAVLVLSGAKLMEAEVNIRFIYIKISGNIAEVMLSLQI